MTNLIATIVVVISTNWVTTDVTFPEKKVHVLSDVATTLRSKPSEGYSTYVWNFPSYQSDATPAVQIEHQVAVLESRPTVFLVYDGVTNGFPLGTTYRAMSNLTQTVTNEYNRTIHQLYGK